MNNGTLLENDVKRIFVLADFKVQTRVKLSGYEVDVFAKHDDISIIVECKQYEKSSINLPNLIYQWSGKNKKIKAGKIVLVVYGSKIPQKHRNLAREEGVIIWTEKDVEKFLDLAIDNGVKGANKIRDVLISNLGIHDSENKKIVDWRPDKDRIVEALDYWKKYSNNLSRRETLLGRQPDASKFKMVFALSENNTYVYCPKIYEKFFIPSETESEFWVMNEESRKRKVLAVNEDPYVKIQSFLNEIAKKYGEIAHTLILPSNSLGVADLEIAKRNDIKCLVGLSNSFLPRKNIDDVILLETNSYI